MGSYKQKKKVTQNYTKTRNKQHRKQIHNANKQTNKQTNKHAKNIKHIGRVIIKFNNERTY